jgi:putative ABC transport system ATP-binding protein
MAATSVTGTPLVKLSGVEKSYPRGTEVVHALRSVQLTLHEQELVALVGRSGSGKTTLLNLLAGWERPDSGEISWLDGRRTDSLESMPWEQVAVLPQSVGLIEELTVRKNIELPLRLAGGLDDGGASDDLMDVLGVAELADRFPHQISLGQQQRTGVARALVVRPALLLADEPTGHQDAQWARRVFSALHEAASRGSCVLVATHSDEVIAHADRVVRMRDGLVELDDKS